MAAAAKTKADARRRKQLQRAGGRTVEPTPERWNHGKIAYGERMEAGIKVPQDLWVRQIDRLNEQGKLTDRQRDAGERLYQHWLASGIKSASTGSYEGGSSAAKGKKAGKRPTETVPATDPFVAYVRALEVLPVQLANVVRNVVVDDCTPTQAVAEEYGRGLSRLQEGLDKLADHYGFERDKI